MEENGEIKYCSLKIKITEDETITISTISNGKEIPIKLNEEDQEEYPCSISFENDKILICQENDLNSIKFINDIINNPEKFKEYSIQYQQQEYIVIAEVLLALIVNEFKKKIEKEYIIEETQIMIPTDNFRSIHRIKTALKSIGLKSFIFNEFDNKKYSNQEEILLELLKKKEQFEENEVIIDDFKVDLSMKEEETIKSYHLNPQCIFEASKYFTTINDFYNLERVVKRFRGNIDKFNYNPIEITSQNRHIFTHLQTLYLFNLNSEFILKDEDIKNRVCLQPISYQEYTTLSSQIRDMITFQNITFKPDEKINVLHLK